MGHQLCFYRPTRLNFTLQNIHCCRYFVIYILGTLFSIFYLKYRYIQISKLLHKPVYSVYTVWTSGAKMLALALVLATASQQLVPATAWNLRIYKRTWPNKRQMGGFHHHHDAPTHSRARAPPTTPKTAHVQRTNNILIATLSRPLRQRTLATHHKP